MYGVKDAVDFFDMVGQTGWHRDIQRTLIHWMGLRDADVVLEAGCGAGHFVLQLAQRVRWITGLDAVESMLKRAQRNAEDHELDNANFVLGDVRHLPFPEHQFDRVICMNLLFMFEHPDGPLAELLRVTKPGGEVVLLNPSTSMNPWSAQSFCEANRLCDFERDSLLSWATAAARYGTVNETGLAKRVTSFGGTVTESLKLLDGMALVSRIVKSAS